MDALVICRNALCSKQINKEKLDLISKFWLCFTFHQGQALLCQLNLTKVNDGMRCQSPACVFRRKIENNVHVVFFGNSWIKFKIVPSSSRK